MILFRMNHLSRVAWSLLPLLVWAPLMAQDIIPFSEIKTGMKGIGRTVFEGTRVEDFQVEVIGTLEHVAPRRNLILVRLSGGPLATTGVWSGMGGSPVFFGERPAGAVPFSWGFAREPVAGVTPIQEMLRVEDKETPAAARPGARRTSAPLIGSPVALLMHPEKLPAHCASYFDDLPPPGASAPVMTPIATPFLFNGVSARAMEGLAPALARGGLVPAQGGTTSRSTNTTPGAESKIVPGGGVGIKLVRGDVEFAAICTVTYRDKDRVMACGHPLLNLGPTDLIMTTASVNGLFPSLQESFKFASAGEEVGAFRQDRATGVFGYLGKRPRLIPGRLDLQPQIGRSKRYSFDVVDDAFLAPYLLYAALNGILSSEEKDYGEVTLSYKPGSTIQVSGEEDIDLKNLFSGELASLYASGTVAFITQLLLNNEYHPVHVNGINLILGYYDERRTGYVERAWVSKDHVRAGETIQEPAGINPFRGPEAARRIAGKVPDAP